MKIFIDRSLIEYVHKTLELLVKKARISVDLYNRTTDAEYQIKRILDQNPEPIVVKDDNGELLKAIKETIGKEMGKLKYIFTGKQEDTKDEGTLNILKRIDKLEEFNASFPYIEPSTIIEGLHQEFDNKQLILEILDMLGEYANDGDAGPGQPILPRRDLHMRDKCYKLQRKLTGTVK